MENLNELIFEFWQNRCIYGDSYGNIFILRRIRPIAMDILHTAGIEWDQVREDFLTSCLLNYTPTRGYKFWEFFSWRCCQAFPLTSQQRKIITQAAHEADQKG